MYSRNRFVTATMHMAMHGTSTPFSNTIPCMCHAEYCYNIQHVWLTASYILQNSDRHEEVMHDIIWDVYQLFQCICYLSNRLLFYLVLVVVLIAVVVVVVVIGS